jgi:hypothetical protein
MVRWRQGGGTAAACGLLVAGLLAAAPTMVVAGPQTPASQSEPARRAAVVHAAYRYDDLLWENDRTAHRIYGHALEAAEPPSSSGIDAWGKKVRVPFADRQLRGGDQHANHGEGLDFYNVHTARGAGGLGIWQDNKLWTSRNYVRYRILKNGPDVADFSVDYAPWPVDVGRKVWETRRFTLPAGTNFTCMISTISSDKPGSLVVGIGLSKRGVAEKLGTYTPDRAKGRFTWWSPTDGDKGAMGLALLVDPASIVGLAQDYDNYLVLVRVTPGKPFVYYMGAAWDRGLDFHTPAAWQQHVDGQHPSFDPRAH